jgi:hypothetical protein
MHWRLSSVKWDLRTNIPSRLSCPSERIREACEVDGRRSRLVEVMGSTSWQYGDSRLIICVGEIAPWDLREPCHSPSVRILRTIIYLQNL